MGNLSTIMKIFIILNILLLEAFKKEDYTA